MSLQLRCLGLKVPPADEADKKNARGKPGGKPKAKPKAKSKVKSKAKGKAKGKTAYSAAMDDFKEQLPDNKI